MKSQFFSTGTIPTETFAKDMKNLLSLSAESRQIFADWFNSLEAPPARIEDAPMSLPQVAQPVLDKLSMNWDQLTRLFTLVTYLYYNALKTGDDVHNMVADLVSLKMVGPKDESGLNEFLDLVRPKAMEIAAQQIRSVYTHGESAYIEEIYYDVDLRLIPAQPFEALRTKIEEYEPKAREFVPIAVINLVLNDGVNKQSTVFETNFSELEDLIVQLQACQKELRFLETFARQLNEASS